MYLDGHIKIHIKIHSKYIEIQYDTYPIGNVPKKDRKSTVTPVKVGETEVGGSAPWKRSY